MKSYKITCHKCKSNNVVRIDADRSVIWGNADRIISARFRLDNQWGWQCIFCGSDDLMTEQERRVIRNPQAPDPMDIKKIVDNLKPDKPLFSMEEI